MELTIGKKEYQLKFGLSFINAIDNIYTQDMNGLDFGVGLEMLNTYMGLGRPTALMNAIKAGTSHMGSKPSNADIEAYLEELASSDDGRYESLFKNLTETMEQAPFLKRTLNDLNQKKEKHEQE